ncbi:uncharacterized protein B0T23DRAFT_388779 [Neurospora hispaniola]|uniref:Uncharacterized protein n=1 Tax=Neurospora hispaniola TaxID=588809 RepID=A0AAJ0HZ64_9PEZI|nr:hypothetical protein B0T23DRAFT_388779 [Neurospora hispaniola]
MLRVDPTPQAEAKTSISPRPSTKSTTTSETPATRPFPPTGPTYAQEQIPTSSTGYGPATPPAGLETHYEWFLDTYDSYTCPVQRANTLRCFLLRHYGGIYIDPNYGCARDLALLLYYPAWVIDRGHGITGARPNHPDWVMLTESMVTYAWIAVSVPTCYPWQQSRVREG